MDAIAFAKVGSPNEDPFDLEGDLLDQHIRVEKLIGEGDLTVVYRGFHKALNAPVAIKCLNLPETLAPELVEPIAESFREGVRVHYRLAQGHLHVVQPLAFGTTLAPRTGATIPYFVREWLEGRSLAADFATRARTKTRPRSAAQAVELLETAADALAHAHAEGVAHHSLGPTNLFLSKVHEKEVLKVLDFGMARNPEVSHAAAGLRLLFSSYAAPEQLNRKLGMPCAATDVFAFALVLFEAMAGRPYFAPGTHPSEMLHVIEGREPPSRRAQGISIPRDLESVLARALAPAPSERHANLRAFWDDVKRVVQRAAPLQAAPKPLSTTSTFVSRPPPSIPKLLAPVQTTVSVLPVKMPASTVASAPSASRAPSVVPPAPVVTAAPATREPSVVPPAPTPAVPATPAPTPAVPAARAPSVPPAPPVGCETPLVPPPSVTTEPAVRSMAALAPAPIVLVPPLRPLPDLAPPPPPASSCTGEVAPPVVTSAVFPVAPDVTTQPEEGLRGPDTVPAPPMFADEAAVASRESRATLDDPLANHASRWTMAEAPAPPVASKTTPRLRYAALAASLLVGLVGVGLIAIVATTHGRTSARGNVANAPDARRMRGVERDPNALVLSDAHAIAPAPARAFDQAAVVQAFDETAANLGSCLRKGSPRGPGSIRVLVQPNGKISRLHIGPPYARTGTGSCISERFSATPLAPFVGSPRAVNYVFTTIGFE
ncbi:Serine/threonine protein kinase [Labilithrix luteola]|uniref:Serine/threonine protein kinase n=1 Tax=Labilithrix luteola TaxID=1391654 RepID=A0A0K1Q3F5_9BACT|nr:Serine/threonine protein kinase [Labilithrix luteola]